MGVRGEMDRAGGQEAVRAGWHNPRSGPRELIDEAAAVLGKTRTEFRGVVAAFS